MTHHLRNFFDGEKFIIIGGGESVNHHSVEELHATDATFIGVNQAARKMDTEFTTLVDPPTCLRKQAGLEAPIRALQKSRCFVAKQWAPRWQDVVDRVGSMIPLQVFRWYQEFSEPWANYLPADYEGLMHAWDERDDLYLPLAPTSTGIATMLAIYMGASKVGVLGLDYTRGYFWNAKKVFVKQDPTFKTANGQWERLALMADRVFGVEVVNLSRVSKIRKLRHQPLEGF